MKAGIIEKKKVHKSQKGTKLILPFLTFKKTRETEKKKNCIRKHLRVHLTPEPNSRLLVHASPLFLLCERVSVLFRQPEPPPHVALIGVRCHDDGLRFDGAELHVQVGALGGGQLALQPRDLVLFGQAHVNQRRQCDFGRGQVQVGRRVESQVWWQVIVARKRACLEQLLVLAHHDEVGAAAVGGVEAGAAQHEPEHDDRRHPAPQRDGEEAVAVLDDNLHDSTMRAAGCHRIRVYQNNNKKEPSSSSRASESCLFSPFLSLCFFFFFQTAARPKQKSVVQRACQHRISPNNCADNQEKKKEVDAITIACK